MEEIKVIGGGLAGCEAAWQLAIRGHKVALYDMKPKKKSPAHHSDSLCELVCSNSLRSDRIENAVGLLKEEMRLLGSLVLSCADATRVPAGGALAVDRDGFSALVTQKLLNHPNIDCRQEELSSIPQDPCIIATGPLTADTLSQAIGEFAGTPLHFYDAAAPIVYKDSLDMSKVYAASRYGRGEDYLNCPMTREEYFSFYRALITAETAPLHEFETPRVFEGCMPVEVMAKRGELTLAYGPLKPVGLEVDGVMPFAVVQLRQDDERGSMYNLVGFQTNLKFPEQKRVFSLIPGLEKAEFARYGVMHRNSFLQSPGFLDWDYSVKNRPLLYFAGQMTGVEGYVESASSGLIAALSLHEKLLGKTPVDFGDSSAIGALGHYVSGYAGSDFQPMNVTFGLMSPLDKKIRNKQQRCHAIAQRALALVNEKKALLS